MLTDKIPPRRNKRAQESEGTSNIQGINQMENHDEDPYVQGQNPVKNGTRESFSCFHGVHSPEHKPCTRAKSVSGPITTSQCGGQFV